MTMKIIIPKIALVSIACVMSLGCDGDSDGDSDSGSLSDVPSQAGPLQDFLDAGEYLDFAAESGVHGSTNGSPHGDVRVFLNASLDDSLAAGNTAHPAGAAAIKELYAADQSTLIGWAVAVKLEADSDGGQGWYWYERLDGTVVADGKGPSGCVGCHVGSGVDFVASEYPLD